MERYSVKKMKLAQIWQNTILHLEKMKMMRRDQAGS